MMWVQPSRERGRGIENAPSADRVVLRIIRLSNLWVRYLCCLYLVLLMSIKIIEFIFFQSQNLLNIHWDEWGCSHCSPSSYIVWNPPLTFQNRKCSPTWMYRKDFRNFTILGYFYIEWNSKSQPSEVERLPISIWFFWESSILNIS